VTAGGRQSGWVTGIAVFAGTLMILVGVFHALTGLAAILENEFFVTTRNYVYEFDVTAWGWAHLIFGLIVAAAGAGIFRGADWARLVGITLVTFSAVGNFFFIPYYPIWALLIIALDVLVIGALAAYEPRRSPARA
jgi:hypothetical protein